MEMDVKSASVLEVYHALVGTVVPRPIAWVTTLNASGVVNLAPFSFFNTFGANPPVVVFSPTLRRDGTKKDTLRNLEQLGEFVLNSAIEPLAEKVNLSSKELAPEESEVTLTGLKTIPAMRVRPPRIAESPVHLEGVVRQIIPIGSGPISANLVIGEIVHIHIEDGILDSHGRVDPRRLRAIARLGGDYFCRSADLFEMPRP